MHERVEDPDHQRGPGDPAPGLDPGTGQEAQRDQPEQQALEAADEQGGEERVDGQQPEGGVGAVGRPGHRAERDPGEQGDHQTGPRHRDLGTSLGPLVEGYREDRATEHAVQVAGLEVGQSRHRHAGDRDQQRRGDGPEVPARGVVRRGAEQPAGERRHEDGDEDRGEDPDHQGVRRAVGAEVRVEQPAEQGADDDAPEEDRDPASAAGAARRSRPVCDCFAGPPPARGPGLARGVGRAGVAGARRRRRSRASCRSIRSWFSS